MAAAQGLSPASIHRIWHAHGLQPHRVRTFKLSTDPRFVEKLTDVVGLYVDPPDKSLVFCVDEKSQIQALQRSQPGLPMKPGRAGTMTHDYKRHGTTTLFAALNVLEGTVIGSCLVRHRHQEFRKFLKQIAGWLRQAYPDDPTMHVSHETTYLSLFVQSRGVLKKALQAHLRQRRTYRRPKGAARVDHSITPQDRATGRGENNEGRIAVSMNPNVHPS